LTEFLKYFFDAPLFQVCLLAIFFWVTLIFLFQKLYKFAALSAVVFFFLLSILALGPLGQHFYERIRGKREPTFKMPDREQVEQCRERVRQYREELKHP